MSIPWKKVRIWTAAVLVVMMGAKVAASSASSAQQSYYGGWADYLWLIILLVVACAFVFHKLAQVNEKMRREDRTLDTSSGKKKRK